MNLKQLNEKLRKIHEYLNEYEEEWEEYRSGAKGSFNKYIALAFEQADIKNANALYQAFPNVGKVFFTWHSGGKQDTPYNN